MTDELWDILAEGAKWARANEDVLVGAHWVGGDPGKAQVYGVAAWRPIKATLMLRNPSDQPQSIRIDPERAFELPKHAKIRTFTMKSPWAEDADKPAITLRAGAEHIVHAGQSPVGLPLGVDPEDREVFCCFLNRFFAPVPNQREYLVGTTPPTSSAVLQEAYEGLRERKEETEAEAADPA